MLKQKAREEQSSGGENEDNWKVCLQSDVVRTKSGAGE